MFHSRRTVCTVIYILLQLIQRTTINKCIIMMNNLSIFIVSMQRKQIIRMQTIELKIKKH